MDTYTGKPSARHYQFIKTDISRINRKFMAHSGYKYKFCLVVK